MSAGICHGMALVQIISLSFLLISNHAAVAASFEVGPIVARTRSSEKVLKSGQEVGDNKVRISGYSGHAFYRGIIQYVVDCYSA